MGDIETPNISISASKHRGNWITFPFIIGAMACLTIASAGWVFNMIVYLIREFNVKSIDAAQVSNVVNGAYSLFPIAGAIIADSFFGSFLVATVSSFISFLGVFLLALTATLDSLRPKPCGIGESNACETPSKLQYTVLYCGFALASLGLGGTRFTIATLGANQFDKEEDSGSFFSWYFFTLYTSSVVSLTAIIYVEDSVSWSLGFWICGALSFIGMLLLAVGSYFFRRDKPQGSPFTSLARVLVAAFRKRKASLSSSSSTSQQDYYIQHDLDEKQSLTSCTNSFRFFNRAALKAEGEIKSDGSIAKPWKLCTIQQVEDLKTLIRVFQIWSTAIFLSVPIAMQSSLTVLQALTMDGRIGNSFKIPPASISVIIFISTSIFLTINDRVLFRIWQKLKGKSPTLFQRIGIGHVCTMLSMMVSALVESRRLKQAHARNSDNTTVDMHVLWVFPQLILVGIGEAFHFPSQVAFYYQEFPDSLRSTSTAVMSLIIGISFYLSTALIDLIRKVTNWLPDNINHGRLDNVYWVLVVVGFLNFCYFLCCAKLYKYQNVQKDIGDETSLVSLNQS